MIFIEQKSFHSKLILSGSTDLCQNGHRSAGLFFRGEGTNPVTLNLCHSNWYQSAKFKGVSHHHSLKEISYKLPNANCSFFLFLLLFFVFVFVCVCACVCVCVLGEGGVHKIT